MGRPPNLKRSQEVPTVEASTSSPAKTERASGEESENS